MFLLGCIQSMRLLTKHLCVVIAGMAFANALLGVCHSMAHKLGGTHHVPHGLANALLISHVIRYNATDAPFKQTCFPQYAVPDALERYAEVADALNLGGKTKQEKVNDGIKPALCCSSCLARSY
jgi:acetaldehyde dehydrogenase/alcohol dehydrogenase